MHYQEKHIEFLKQHNTKSLDEITRLFNAHFLTNQSTKAISSFLSRYKVRSERLNNKPSTAFKKGHKPAWTMPIGTIFTDKKGRSYIKISDVIGEKPKDRFRPLQQHIWINHHGEIPENHIVIFVNNNVPDKYTIENLVCISRREFVIINNLMGNISNDFVALKIAMAKLIIAKNDAIRTVQQGGL